MDISTSLNKLFSLHQFGIKLGLDNTVEFLNHLGNPEKYLQTIHIAGSNGKGSTASFIASILQEFGYKVGLYTSPHFVKFNERIQINRVQINDDYISKFISEHETYIDEHKLTFFEVTTVMAFQYFREMNTDYNVIETGLGGRLDSTNVLDPRAIVITSISLEHTNVLGNTISEIASEKAAIIKNGSKVFASNLSVEALKVIEQKCSETNSNLYLINDYLDVSNNVAKLKIDDNNFLEVKSPLKGSYQKFNAALAALTVAKSFMGIKVENLLQGIDKVIVNTGLQGRYEYYSKNPIIIFDSAHNPEGVENFLKEFETESDSYEKRYLIFGAMRDKSISEMLKKLSVFFEHIFVCEINYERAAKAGELIKLCKQLNINASKLVNPAEYIDNFRKTNTGTGNCLVVLGSMYLLGEIKGELNLRTS